MKKALVLSAALAVSGPALAQGFEEDNLYFGGGLNANSVSGADDAVGYQYFGGYAFEISGLERLDLAAEVGYLESGDFERNSTGAEFSADGVWTTAVISYPLTARDWSLLGRLGVDFGDDDGLMAGGGVGYQIDRYLQLRGEVVARDNIDSLQANLVYRF